MPKKKSGFETSPFSRDNLVKNLYKDRGAKLEEAAYIIGRPLQTNLDIPPDLLLLLQAGLVYFDKTDTLNYFRGQDFHTNATEEALRVLDVPTSLVVHRNTLRTEQMKKSVFGRSFRLVCDIGATLTGAEPFQEIDIAQEREQLISSLHATRVSHNRNSRLTLGFIDAPDTQWASAASKELDQIIPRQLSVGHIALIPLKLQEEVS